VIKLLQKGALFHSLKGSIGSDIIYFALDLLIDLIARHHGCTRTKKGRAADSNKPNLLNYYCLAIGKKKK
jgi:hypothetical protein